MAEEVDNKDKKSFLNLSVEGEAARVKGFRLLPEIDDLCIGFLNNVSVEMLDSKKVKENGSINEWEYAGFISPRLTFNFTNFIGPDIATKDVERRFRYSEGCIVSITNAKEEMTDKALQKLYGDMWLRLKHILEIFSNECKIDYRKDSNLVHALASIDSIDIIKGKDIQKRIDAFTKLFKAIAHIFNTGNNGNPIFIRSKDIPIIVYMKFAADWSTHRYYTFPTYVEDGFLEVCRLTDKKIRINPPSIKIKDKSTIVLRGKGKYNGKIDNSDSPNDGEYEHPEMEEGLRIALGYKPMKG